MTTRLSSVLRNTGYVALGEAAKPAMSFLLILVISRMLGRDGIGTYAIVLTFCGLFELIATAGLGPLIVRGIAANRSEASSYVSGSIGVAILVSAVLMPAMLFAVHSLGYSMEVERGIRLLTYTLLIAVVQQHLVSVCEGLQYMRLRALVSVADTAGRLIVGVAMVLQGAGIFGVIQGMVIVRVITTVLALVMLTRYADLSISMRAMLRVAPGLALRGAPFLVMTVASAAFWAVNTLMLSTMNPVEDVGVYNAAWRITEILKNIFYSYLIVLLPMMSQSFARSIDDLSRECDVSLKYLAILTLPVATGLTVLAPRVIGLVYGREFDGAVAVLQVLAWTVCLFSLVLVFARVLVASHNHLLDLYANIAALAMNIVLGWMLIDALGPVGAAIATLLSLAAFGVLEYAMVVRRLFKPDLGASLVRPAVASLVMSGVVYGVGGWPLALVVVLGAVAYFTALVGLGTFSQVELRAVRELAGPWLGSLPPFLRRPLTEVTKP